MTIELVTPAAPLARTGNQISAMRWARLLRKLGHRVRVAHRYSGGNCDALIALHARRSFDSIREFATKHPERPLIVVLTGTDLYRDIKTDGNAQQSLELATRLVVLQSMALKELAKRLHGKTKVIYQSATRVTARAQNDGVFRVCVVGHLRAEKDPLRTAFAVRRLPDSSKISVIHIGGALEGSLRRQAERETRTNPRYRWVGELPYAETRRLLAASHLLSLTSIMEGSSNALAEALASSVPVVASKIPGLIGTLGPDYPGYFRVGDTDQLARLLHRAETDRVFYRTLKRRCRQLAAKVEPSREERGWRKLFEEIV
ncbi:MAG TPA: selenoneine biosynthesis selenosugar synthase SenB [Candidatus Acidoferrales bacterium]|nr:selenoneine biosynthesis selenosugar synthase SenB [Candidatus Acidoferrales bacterium]